MNFARLAVCVFATVLLVGCGDAAPKEARPATNPSVEKPKGVGPQTITNPDGTTTTTEAAGGTMQTPVE